MTWLFEERQGALPVILIAVISVVILGTGWAKTGRREVLFGLAAVVLLALLVLVAQRLVTTEGEKALATLQVIAKDVERNDLKAVLDHIHTGASSIRSQAEQEFPHYKFTEVKITKIHEVRVELDHVPPQIEVDFTVAVTGQDAEGLLEGQTVFRWVRVTFNKDEGRWRVKNYEHADPQRAIMKD